MTERSRRQFQSMYDALHPVGCERCLRPEDPWLVPDGIKAIWRRKVSESSMWRRVA